MPRLKAPFPYFGGKSMIADTVWRHLGNVDHYVEPFFGSGAVLLARPHVGHTETVNDKDGFVSNFWRALRADPDAVAEECDWPVIERDLHARHYWLITEGARRLHEIEGDPEAYDVRVAAWWAWGLSAWIGSGWCAGHGSWQWTTTGWSRRSPEAGITRKLPNLGDAGKGMHGRSVFAQPPNGISRQLPHLVNRGKGVHHRLGADASACINRKEALVEWFRDLAARLREVRIVCGDWSRICTPAVLFGPHGNGTVGVFLDPPYTRSERERGLYREDHDVAAEVAAWAFRNGDDPRLRIALCGYDGEHAPPPGWRAVGWKAHGGYGNHANNRGRENAHRERIWFSPHCVSQEDEDVDVQPGLL